MFKLATRLRKKYKKAFFKPYTLEADVLETQFPFYVGTYEGSRWYEGEQLHEVIPELTWTQAHLATGEIVADVGAHHGFFSLLYTRWVGGDGAVYAFECGPTNFSILERNKLINGVENLYPQECAVGAAPGDVSIADDSSGIFLPTKGPKNIQVPQTTLDHFFEKAGVQPTMIKIDVEGYENEVLEGAKNLLKQRPKVILELHHFMHAHPKERLQAIFEMFASYQQTFWQPHPGLPIEPFPLNADNLILASKKPNPHLYLMP